MSCVGIIGDTHLPYHHERYLEFVYDKFYEHDVDTVVHIGDFIDHHALSFHDSEPMLQGVTGEYESVLNAAKPWYDAFPEVTLIEGNHDRLPARQLRKVGMEPTIFMKPLKSIYKMPRKWKVKDWVKIDDVLYHHGETASGVNGFRKDCEQRMMCTVTGHNHSNAGISATATGQELVWGLAVGCGVDHKHMAFAYGKHFAKKPILACGIVDNGVPSVHYMPLGKKLRRRK